MSPRRRAAGVPARRARLAVIHRVSHLLLAGALLLGGAPASPVVVAQDATPALAGTPLASDGDVDREGGTITPTRDEATADFPAGVAFGLIATAPFPVVRVELLYRPAGEQTLRLALPELPARHGPNVAIEHRVDFREGELPPGIDLRYRWRLIGDDGVAVETAEASVPWRDDRFAWDTFAGERAVVHAYGGDDRFNRAILETTEDEIARLEDLYGAPLAEPVRVWIYATMDDLAGALRPNSETWVAGAAYPRLGLILAVIAPGDRAEAARVIPHEVSHLVLDRATGNPFSEPPAWLDEGLAVSQERGDDAPYLALARQGLLDQDTQSLPALAGAFPYDPDGAQLAYAQSLSVVAFIRDRYGDDGLERLIAAFRQPVTVEAAVREALGVSLAELETGWGTALANETGPFADASRGGSSPWETILAASGALTMAFAALLAVGVGVTVLRRARKRRWEDEPEVEGTGTTL